MSFEQKLNILFELQNDLNKVVHPEWKKQGYAYPDAMMTEMIELYNHLNWEWWKNLGREINWGQVKMEATDVMLFLLCETMVHNKQQDLVKTVNEPMFKTYLDGNRKFQLNATLVKSTAKTFLYALTSREVGEIRPEDMSGLFFSFWQLIISLGLTFDDVYKLYIAKAQLNRIRWKNGYKKKVYIQGEGGYTEGAYIKMWDGLEDNEWLTNHIETMDVNSSTFADDVLKALEVKYKEVKAPYEKETTN